MQTPTMPIGDFRFDTAYGKDMRRLIRWGSRHCITPGYCPATGCWSSSSHSRPCSRSSAGTDTLGVGVNIPIRTVLFTKLAKFDGREASAFLKRPRLQADRRSRGSQGLRRAAAASSARRRSG